MMRGDTVEDAVRLLHEVCSRMDGSIQPQFTLQKSSIRKGMNAAVAEVKTRFGTEITVAFFPDKSRKAKQLRMYGKNATKDFMPVVSDEKDPFMHTCAPLPSLMPPICWGREPTNSLSNQRLLGQTCDMCNPDVQDGQRECPAAGTHLCRPL